MTYRNREMLAFLAGWLDKMSVASFAVGIFQEQTLLGMGFGSLFFGIALFLKHRSIEP